MLIFSLEKMFASFVIAAAIRALTQSIPVAVITFAIVFVVATLRPPMM